MKYFGRKEEDEKFTTVEETHLRVQLIYKAPRFDLFPCVGEKQRLESISDEKCFSIKFNQSELSETMGWQ